MAHERTAPMPEKIVMFEDKKIDLHLMVAKSS